MTMARALSRSGWASGWPRSARRSGPASGSSSAIERRQRVDALGEVLAGRLLQLAVGGGDVQDVVADLEDHAEAAPELGAGLDLVAWAAPPVSAPMRHDAAVSAAVLPLMALK